MPRVLWHHHVHRHRGEALYFLRLGFYPTYMSQPVASALIEMLRANDVKSAVCYELFGPHDLLLRVWLPKAIDFGEFQTSLIDRLAATENLTMCDPFQVHRFVRHWLFPAENGAVRAPDDALVNALNDDQIAAAETGAMPAEQLGKLEHDALLGAFSNSTETTDPADPGTKFAVVVGGDPRLTTAQHEEFELTLRQLLDTAERLDQRSLYAGSGFGHFLILGRIKGSPLYVLTDDLLTRIANAKINRHYGARTFTHVSGRRNFVFVYESLIDVIPSPGDSRGSNPADAHAVVQGDPSARQVPQAGEMFNDRFQLLREVGRGGFSVVFEALDEEVESQHLALKFFLSGNAYAQVRREVSVLRKIRHDNVIQVFWADRDQSGSWYLISEFVEGEPLTAYLDPERRLQIDQVVRIGSELLAALEAIHPDERRIEALRSGELSQEQFEDLQELQETGFVHRDIKPANIILTPRGIIKLLDFNIASRVGETVDTVSGTRPYQAPDMINLTWDVSTDLFATGVVLYELICGEHPYPHRDPRSPEGPRAPGQFRDDLSTTLAEFLSKASAQSSAERFSSAREMRAALASVQL